MARILPSPLVAQIAVGTFFVVVWALVRIRGVHGTETESGLQLARLPDPLLGGHEAERRPADGEGSQVLLANQELTVRGEPVEEGESGGPDQPVGLRIVVGHRV